MNAAATSSVGAATTDAHLVIRAQDGDRAAFEELFRRHAHPAWRLALAVAGTRDAAEAAVAEGFTATFRHLATKTTSVATPFRLLVVRATFDAACQEARRAPASAASAPAANEVVGAFRRLPDRWRATLWLTAVEGGTAAQVAPLLGLSEDAAASLARKAEAGLRERVLHAAPQVAGTLDVREGLRPLVVGLPAGLRSATTQRWSDWHAAQRDAGRRGVLAALPGGARLERGIAVAASTVVALGVVGAFALSDSSGGGARAPIVAAPAAAAPPANAAATVSPLRPAVTYTGSAPRAGRVYAGSAVAAPVTTRTLSGNVARATTAPALSAAAAAPAATPEPAASADPAPGVELGTTVADEPVTAGVDTDGSGGLQVGPVVVGSPPPADEPPALVIDTGLLGALELPL